MILSRNNNNDQKSTKNKNKVLGSSICTFPAIPGQWRRVMSSWERLEGSVVALWPWLLKSTACNNFYCAEIICSICLHNSSSGQQLVMARMNVVSFYYFYRVQFWFSGWLFNDVIAALHAKIAAKAPRPRIPLGLCGLDNTLMYALSPHQSVSWVRTHTVRFKSIVRRIRILTEGSLSDEITTYSQS